MKKRSVNRCICHQKTFKENKKYGEHRNIESANKLMEEGVCSTKCGICKPYVKLMLSTGSVEFNPSDIYRF